MGMDSFPLHLPLRDGADVMITPVQPGDGEQLMAFYRQIPEEDRQFLRDDVTTQAWVDDFLRKVVQGEVVSLIAEQGEQVVGHASLYRSLHGWTRHVGEIRMAVATCCRRQGLGTGMASALVKVATDLGIEKIIVQVVDNQVAARRSFEKLGFHKEAVLPHHVMDIGGTKRDLLVLANDVSHIWAAMETLNQG